ncbi:surface-adhesin E family protein [Dissulfurispira sp.]|uniref:surface-adhesin E family protein n=1 Tax=Dissulfurispira sp. TaxID=2817609 RepID=UPI002FD9EF3E
MTKDNKGRDWLIQENKRLGLSSKGYENYEYTIFLKEISCSDKMSRLLSEADYTKEGNLLAKSEYPYAEWKPIVPESDDEALQKAVCVIKASETQETENK